MALQFPVHQHHAIEEVPAIDTAPHPEPWLNPLLDEQPLTSGTTIHRIIRCP